MYNMYIVFINDMSMHELQKSQIAIDKVNKTFSLEKKITYVNIDLFTCKNSGMCLGYTLERVKERKSERKNAA